MTVAGMGAEVTHMAMQAVGSMVGRPSMAEAVSTPTADSTEAGSMEVDAAKR
jgi:hypothetical protein